MSLTKQTLTCHFGCIFTLFKKRYTIVIILFLKSFISHNWGLVFSAEPIHVCSNVIREQNDYFRLCPTFCFWIISSDDNKTDYAIFVHEHGLPISRLNSSMFCCCNCLESFFSHPPTNFAQLNKINRKTIRIHLLLVLQVSFK